MKSLEEIKTMADSSPTSTKARKTRRQSIEQKPPCKSINQKNSKFMNDFYYYLMSTADN